MEITLNLNTDFERTLEQLKTKYRYFTSQKEFYRFSNSYFNNKKNPLTETVKCLEDNENKNKKK